MTEAEGSPNPPRVALLVCALILAPTLAYRVGVDQGIFAYMGSALLDGDWPYISAWEEDYPGLMFLQAAEIFVFGKSIWMFRLFDILFQLGNAYFILRIANKLSGRVAAMVAPVLYCLIYQGYGTWDTAQREGFGMLFILAGYWLYLTAERRPAWVTTVIAGLGMGFAVTIKPTLLAMSLFYLPLILEVRTLRAMMLTALAGLTVVAPTLVIVGIYWAKDGLTQLYEVLVSYQPIYSARLRGDAPLLTYWIEKVSRLGRNAIVLPIVYAPFLVRAEFRRERLMVWLGLVGAVYSVFVQGTFAGYHYLPGMALGAILVGDIYSTVSAWALQRFEWPPDVKQSVQRMGARLMLVAAVPVYMWDAPVRDLLALQFLKPPRPLEYRNENVFDYTESYDVAAYLREHTSPDQPVQVWGYEALVYYFAERDSASRFLMTQPLVIRVPGQDLTPMQKRWRAEFVADINRRQPPYVAVVRDDNWWWAPDEKTSEQLLDDFPEWKGVIERDYTLETTIGRFLVYRRLASRAW